MLYCTHTIQADNLSSAIKNSNIRLVQLLLEEKKLTPEEFEKYTDVAEQTIQIKKKYYAESLTKYAPHNYLIVSYIAFVIGLFDLVMRENDICLIQPRHIAASVSLFSLMYGIHLIIENADQYYFDSIAIKKMLLKAR